MNLGKADCVNGRWMELDYERIQWQASVLSVSNLPILLS